MTAPIEIDGSYGEGGGQMMRTAVALSLLTGLPFRMEAIRARRAKPGLKAQHLHVLKAAVRMSRSAVTGAEIGSSEVSFFPGRLRGAEFEVDIGTAGSITLLLQTLLPAAVFADGATRVRVRGGTDVAKSPTFDYFREVVVPAVRPFAREIDVELVRRGFYPRGGGEVRLRVEPRFGGAFEEIRRAVRSALPPLDLLEAGHPYAQDAYSVASIHLEGRRVIERQIDGVRSSLRYREIRVHRESAASSSPGSAATVVARMTSGAIVGGDALGERGKRAEDVGREAAENLLVALDAGAPVDEHLADHLVPWLALRGGRFRASAITDHTRTNCWLVERFVGPTFRLDEERSIVASA